MPGAVTFAERLMAHVELLLLWSRFTAVAREDSDLVQFECFSSTSLRLQYYSVFAVYSFATELIKSGHVVAEVNFS